VSGKMEGLHALIHRIAWNRNSAKFA
jgi:hypothetical protein